MTLAVLSLQRLLTLANPEHYKITSYKKSFLIITGIWLYTLCISIPPFFGFGKFVPETSGMTWVQCITKYFPALIYQLSVTRAWCDHKTKPIFRCAPDWESNQHLLYTWYWTIFGFLAPLFVILYTSYKTILHLRKVRRTFSNLRQNELSKVSKDNFLSWLSFFGLAENRQSIKFRLKRHNLP